MGQVIDLDSRRNARTQKNVHERIDERDIEQEMKENGKTTKFRGSHTVVPVENPRSIKEMERVLGNLDTLDKKRARRILEDILLDIRVDDRDFRCISVFMRLNKDPEILALYNRIRTALFVNLKIILPEF